MISTEQILSSAFAVGCFALLVVYPTAPVAAAFIVSMVGVLAASYLELQSAMRAKPTDSLAATQLALTALQIEVADLKNKTSALSIGQAVARPFIRG